MKPVRRIGQVSPDSGSPTQSWLATATTSAPGTRRSSCAWTAAGSSKHREAAALGHSFTESLLELLLAEPELQVFQYEMILEARRRPELADAVSALYERYVSALAEGLMASGLTRNVQVVAKTLFASLDGLVLQYLAGVERELIAASLEEVHDVLLLRAGAGGQT